MLLGLARGRSTRDSSTNKAKPYQDRGQALCVKVDFVEMLFFEWSWSVDVGQLPLQVLDDCLDELLPVLTHLKHDKLIRFIN